MNYYFWLGEEMKNVGFVLPRYAENGPRPVLDCRERHDRGCGDNYGDMECPFCDKVLVKENALFYVGQSCRFCAGEITGVSGEIKESQIAIQDSPGAA